MRIAAVVVALLVAMAAGGFAWQRDQALEEASAELARVISELQKAKAEVRAMTADVAAARKELVEHKIAVDQLRTELTTAQSFLASEKAVGARLREELGKTKEQLAMAHRLRAVQARRSQGRSRRAPWPSRQVLRARRSGAARPRGKVNSKDITCYPSGEDQHDCHMPHSRGVLVFRIVQADRGRRVSRVDY